MILYSLHDLEIYFCMQILVLNALIILTKGRRKKVADQSDFFLIYDFFIFYFSICISKDPKSLKRMFFIKDLISQPNNLCSKGKILSKISIFHENIGKVFNGIPCKNVTNIFAYFSVS